jgi:pimeloyl-ACP methyl ester carboxylesterase
LRVPRVAIAAVLVAAGLALTPALGAQAQISQPPQPKHGPGGSDYTHKGVRISSGGTGADAWYAFEPTKPRLKKAPLAIVMHGYYEFSGYEQMAALIRHTVRKGSVVIYPRWQTDVATPCPGPYNIEPCITSAVNGINGALEFLRSDPKRVQPQLRKASYLGFSFGGIVTANMANRYASLGLPRPRAIFLDDPHDGGAHRRRRAGAGRFAGRYPLFDARAMSHRRRRRRNASRPRGHLQRRPAEAELDPSKEQGRPSHIGRRARRAGSRQRARSVRDQLHSGRRPRPGRRV